MGDQDFSIAAQVEKELEEFSNQRIHLVKPTNEETIRNPNKVKGRGYSYNQGEALAVIDLFYNSKFENGERDKLNQRKIFMNVSKFRTEVAAKQTDIDTKNIRFVPEDTAYPWAAFLLQKEFREWSKETYFGELLNECVDNFPKYGTVVLKKIKNRVEFVHLQLLKNEQTAKDLRTAAYVIEEHPDMSSWEISAMKDWKTEGLDWSLNNRLTVYERYGHVPTEWLKRHNPNARVSNDPYTDALVIVALVPTKGGKEAWVFYADAIKERPYLEVHWNKQLGRWLGCGTMEDLVENQQAVNIAVNLKRRHLHWSAKKIFQSASRDFKQKNLIRDVPDGAILEIEQNGEIKEVDLSSKTNAEFDNFLSTWERNADQKAFTYEVATGEALPSGTPFRLGAILNSAVQSYFEKKRERMGLFLKRVITEFLLPEFLRDMGNRDKLVSMFSDEPGFEALKAASLEYVTSEAIRVSLLTGQAVDVQTIRESVDPFQAIRMMFFDRPKGFYEEVKSKVDIDITGESVDVPVKIESLTNLYTLLAQQGDRDRAEKVLRKAMALAGENLDAFGPPPTPQVAQPTPTPQTTEQPVTQ